MPKRSYKQFASDYMDIENQYHKKPKYYGKFKQNSVMPRANPTGTIEKKFVDTVNQLFVITPTLAQTPTLINAVAEGSDFTQRIGRKVTWSNFTLRWQVRVNPATPTPSNLRCMVVYDRQPNGALATFGDILNVSGSTVIDETSLQNLNNRDRFWTLMDKVVSVSPQGPEIQFRKKFKRLFTDTQYKGTGATIADISSGAFYLLFIPDGISGQASGVAPQVNYSMRMKFVDN